MFPHTALIKKKVEGTYMLQVKIIFSLFYLSASLFFFSNQVNLSQSRSLCFNLDQFGASKKHKSQVIACQYIKFIKANGRPN